MIGFVFDFETISNEIAIHRNPSCNLEEVDNSADFEQWDWLGFELQGYIAFVFDHKTMIAIIGVELGGIPIPLDSSLTPYRDRLKSLEQKLTNDYGITVGMPFLLDSPVFNENTGECINYCDFKLPSAIEQLAATSE